MKHKPRRCLEAGVKSDKERVVASSLKNVLLCLHPVYVFVVSHQLLLYHFHGVYPLGGLQLNHENLGVGATSDHLDEVEVCEGDHVGLLLAASSPLLLSPHMNWVVGELRRWQHRLLGGDILRVSRPPRHRRHAPGIADDAAELVALLVDEQPALDALEALPAQAPDAVMAVRARSLPVEPLGLKTGKCCFWQWQGCNNWFVVSFGCKSYISWLQDGEPSSSKICFPNPPMGRTKHPTWLGAPWPI